MSDRESMAGPFWYCNKCGAGGNAASREVADQQHREESPRCNYFASWGWTPPSEATAAPAPAAASTEDPK